MDATTIGIDVSKDRLDVAAPEGLRQWPNTPQGHQELVEQLAPCAVASVSASAPLPPSAPAAPAREHTG